MIMQKYFNKTLLIMLCSLFLMACGGEDKSFNLEGHIEGYSNGMAYLKQFNGKEFANIDSTNIKEGHFSFSGEVEQPQLCRIVVQGHKYPIRYFFLEAGTLHYSSHLKGKRMSVPVIEGTPTQNEYGRFQREKNAIYRLRLAFQRQEFKDAEEKRKVGISMSELSNKIDSVKNAFLHNKHTPVLRLFLIKESCGSVSDYRVLAKQLKAFEATYSAHPLYLAIQERMEALKRIAPGQQAPAFAMTSLEGKTIQLSDFKGKVTLIDFWASWCGPCRKENPNMVRLYRDFHEKGLEILGVSLDKDKDKWAKAVQKDNLTWNHVCDFKKWNCPLVEKYAVKGVPFTVLIDRQGKIIASGLHGTELKRKIKEALR